MKIQKWKQKICAAAAALWALTASAFASGNLQSSELGVGIKNMINDVSGFLVVLCPLSGGAAAVYFLIRRSMADEQDGKMWTHRIHVAILCGVAGMLVSGIITLLSSYF